MNFSKPKIIPIYDNDIRYRYKLYDILNTYPDSPLLVDKHFDNDTSIKNIRFNLIGCKTKHKGDEGYGRRKFE